MNWIDWGEKAHDKLEILASIVAKEEANEKLELANKKLEKLKKELKSVNSGKNGFLGKRKEKSLVEKVEETKEIISKLNKELKYKLPVFVQSLD
jgi:hypothetical protein